MIFMHKEEWKIAELAGLRWADEDGSVLSRVTNSDEWEGFIKTYYEQVCRQPNSNMILTGISVT
jgi:hypothetical protein